MEVLRLSVSKKFAKKILGRIYLVLPSRLKFGLIHSFSLFGVSDSKSGPGSDAIQTREIVSSLPELFKKYNVKSVLDVPCGDLNWMPNLFPFIEQYTGADIVSDLIVSNRLKFPGKDFIEVDVRKDSLKKYDLIFCRDLLVHLSNSDSQKVLSQFKKSGSKYLLVTSFTERKFNQELQGIWRPMNLELPPYNLINIIEILNEKCTEANGQYLDKSLILVPLNP